MRGARRFAMSRAGDRVGCSVQPSTSPLGVWLPAGRTSHAERTRRRGPGSWAGLLRESGTAGNLTTDAHLAALAHGADVVSYDRDFARFRGLRHRLPG